MIRLPPKSTLTDTLFPDTTLVRSRSGGRRGTSSAPARPAWIPSLNIWCCDVAAIGREGQAVVQAIINIGIKQPISLLGQQIGFIIKHRSEEHTSELQSLMRSSYAVFCLKKKKKKQIITTRKQ